MLKLVDDIPHAHINNFSQQKCGFLFQKKYLDGWYCVFLKCDIMPHQSPPPLMNASFFWGGLALKACSWSFKKSF